MTTKEELEAPIDNPNKVKRRDELYEQIESGYHTILDEVNCMISDTTTIKKTIQQNAFAYEEVFKLFGQDWQIQQIGSIIVKALKLRGFPESKYKYVYRALEQYDDKFFKPIDHSSIQSVDKSTKEVEQFYHTNAQEFYEALATLERLAKIHHLIPRRDLQAIIPAIMDVFDDNERIAKYEGIPLVTNTQHSFDGGPERFEDPIRIQKPIPRVPEKMTEELNIWTNTFLPALLNKLTEYPISDPEIEKSMAAGWAALRHAHDPATDDKYRETFMDWIQIVQFADDSFKHHAASHFKTKTWKGTWRKLTREQIGARQKTIPVWCKWFFETVPGFMAWIAWYRIDKKQYLSGFSEDLSPKLSDRSIR